MSQISTVSTLTSTLKNAAKPIPIGNKYTSTLNSDKGIHIRLLLFGKNIPYIYLIYILVYLLIIIIIAKTGQCWIWEQVHSPNLSVLIVYLCVLVQYLFAL